MRRALRHLPNALSALRLIAAPIAAYCIFQQRHGDALAMFVLAGASDALDGWLAKTFALTSKLGAWLDPAADKLLMFLSFIALAHIGAVSWFVVAAVVGRDAAIILGILVAKLVRAPLEVKPLTAGKVSTFVQVLYVAFVLLTLTFCWHMQHLVDLGERMVVVAALWSIVAYLGVWLKAMERLVRAGS